MSGSVFHKEIPLLIFAIKNNNVISRSDHGFLKKYCPIWIYDCVVSQSVNDFILYGVDLTQPCKKFASGLSDMFEEVSLEELVRASEVIVQF